MHIMMNYFDRLFPICRSITGDGVRETLKILSEIIPLHIHETASGTTCFDWTIPDEWNIREAYIETLNGERLIDFKNNNLHVMNYSVPVNAVLSHSDLMKRIHSIPTQPEAIPYRTSYYSDNWGFSIKENQRHLFKHDSYKVVIDSTKAPGHLTYGDLVLKGESEEEILLSTYVCHPSMANNELSGPLVTAFLYKKIASLPRRRFTYRFVFAPETIGVIAYLSKYGEIMKKNIHAGYVLTCCGDKGNYTYKKSRRGNSISDRAALQMLTDLRKKVKVVDFFPSGSDERQYCSPGFNFPVGSIMRTMYGDFPQYHTSLDNRDLVSEESFQDSVETYYAVILALEANHTYVSNNPYCEPQLGKRGLYPTVGGGLGDEAVRAIQYLMNYSDGENDLLEIANKSGLSMTEITVAAKHLIQGGLLKELTES